MEAVTLVSWVSEGGTRWWEGPRPESSLGAFLCDVPMGTATPVSFNSPKSRMELG